MIFLPKVLLLILVLPLLVLGFCLVLPILILALLLGLFFPVLRTSYRSFGIRFPEQNKKGNEAGTGNRDAEEDVSDVECTVLHAETLSQETEENTPRVLK